MRTHTLCFVLAAMIGFASAANGWNNGSSNDNQLPESLERKVRNLRTDLESKGYEVARGAWNLFRIEDCKFAIETIGNCLGNNPAAPYLIPSVPLWPDEFVDQNVRDLLGPTPDDTWWTYRLDEREALVVLAQLPPPGRYFGMQTYIFSREGEIDTTDEVYQSVTDDPFMQNILFMMSPNPSRVLVFSSIGNSNNNVVTERQSGAAFNQQRFFIITPDAVMERALTEALLRAGVPNRNHVFIEPVSTDLARLGLGSGEDDLMTLMRYSLPQDETAGDEWRRQLPLAVLRVRDTNTARPTEPYPKPAYDERIARSELGLKGDVENLVEAVKQLWGQPAAKDRAFESLMLTVDLIGQHCLERPMNCLGDTQDADYQISPTESIDSGEVLAVVGTLGTATGNATYTSLAPNRIPALVGVTNISDPDLKGSASAFSETVGNTDKLYVYYFARECGNLPNCREITEEMVPRGDAVKIVQRNYVVPGATRGPEPKKLVNPTLIQLDGAKRPSSR
ncbi:uncharacterized protein sS8_4917 [Methylocaldum marinum]|uniref:Uncharacterized protein n=1 Tax=Methylocaldum marinum TaxID=1432792 RepID=A0A250KYY0_9GAMM|nr:hypothetical protein [Methylocaldum marinum]BBA36840.1 uncharacterized protein sS8_4917 [Methylocaldum marinum]